MCIIYIFCDMNVYRWCNYVSIAAKCTRKDETDTYMLEIQLNLHLRLPLVSKHPSKHKTFYSQSNHYSWNLSYINDHLCKRPRPLFEWRLKKFSVIVFIIFLQVSGPLLGRDPLWVLCVTNYVWYNSWTVVFKFNSSLPWKYISYLHSRLRDRNGCAARTVEPEYLMPSK